MTLSCCNRYIRAIGFIYLRLCYPPQKLWEWFEPYLDDPQEFTLAMKGQRKTYVRGDMTLQTERTNPNLLKTQLATILEF